MTVDNTLRQSLFERMLEHMIESVVDVAAVQQRALDGLVEMLADLDVPADDTTCIDHLEALERIKSAAAAAQAAITDQLDQRRPHAPGRVAGRRDAALGAEVGLARRESPHRGRAHLALARALLHDLPHTYPALRRGDLSERRAQIIASEPSHPTREHRLAVDRDLAGDPGALDGLGETRLTQAVRRLALTLDEATALARRRRAHASRRVTGRLLGDGMAQLSITLADWQYAAVMTSLTEATDRDRAAGDPRTPGRPEGPRLRRDPPRPRPHPRLAALVRPHPRHHRPPPGRHQPRGPLHRATVLPLPEHRRPGRPRSPDPPLHRPPPRARPAARPDLPHPLVRRPHPPRRPRPPPRRRRTHQRPQRPRPLRELQPRQRTTRLAPPTRQWRPLRPAHHRRDHPHRPPTPQHRPTTTPPHPPPPRAPR